MGGLHNLIYELMFNSKRPLGDDKSQSISRDAFFNELAKLEALAKSSNDRIVELRLEGFRDGGRALGLLN